MNNKTMLVKCLTAAVCNNVDGHTETFSQNLIGDIVENVRTPEVVVEGDSTREIIINLKDMARWILNSKEKIDYVSFIQRARMACGDDTHLLSSLEDTATLFTADTETRDNYVKLTSEELHKIDRNNKFKRLMQDAHRKLMSTDPGKLDLREFIANLSNDIMPYASSGSMKDKEFILDMIKMSDPGSIKPILERAHEDALGSGGLKSGWHAFNRMLGSTGNMRFGMFVLVGALTHNYKSGLVHDLFRHWCMYNDPIQREDKGHPTLVFCSSENRSEEDIMRMYVAIKENLTGEEVVTANVDVDEASNYISEHLTKTGFDVRWFRIDPTDFTYMHMYDLINDLIAEGCDVQAVSFDYLALINKKGCNQGVAGEDIRNLMQRVRTFMSARDILFMTPHQLSQQAMDKKREGVNNFLSEIAKKNYWDGSKRIVNEVDLEIYCNIESVADDKFYLHVHRGKHRTVKPTPVKHQQFYQPFHSIGYLKEDIMGEDTSLATLTTAEYADFDM